MDIDGCLRTKPHFQGITENSQKLRVCNRIIGGMGTICSKKSVLLDFAIKGLFIDANEPKTEHMDITVSPLSTEAEGITSYRFPAGNSGIEVLPDYSQTLLLRFAWQRGKTRTVLFETTPFRPVGEIQHGGDTFALFLSRHARQKKNKRVLLAGRRRTGRSASSFLRYGIQIEGAGSRLHWQWNIAGSPDFVGSARIRLLLPFSGSGAQRIAFTSPFATMGIWHQGILMQVSIPNPMQQDAVLEWENQGIALLCPDADLTNDVRLHMETQITPARTRQDAESGMLRLLADLADRQAQRTSIPPFLTDTIATATAFLMRESLAEKRSLDRLMVRSRTKKTVHVNDDAAFIARALLFRFYETGDELMERRARLISRGVCDFQITQEESPHFGAFWEAWHNKKRYGDRVSGTTLSVETTARTAQALFTLHDYFQTEILQRSAVTAAQWLLLKLDREGLPFSARFEADGEPLADSSAWIAGEAIITLVKAFRHTKNDVFLKAALRMAAVIQLKLVEMSPLFDWESVCASHLAACIEGFFLLSQEYERKDFIETASRLGIVLRSRIAPEGNTIEPVAMTGESPVAPTLATVRASLAFAQGDFDSTWLLTALRGLHFVWHVAAIIPDLLTYSDWSALCHLPTELLLCIAGQGKGCVVNREKGTVTRNFQLFQPDSRTRDYIRVTTTKGTPLDYMALVCASNLQVLLAVISPSEVDEAVVYKSGKRPYVKNLTTEEYDQRIRLSPMGDGHEIHMALLLLDT